MSLVLQHKKNTSNYEGLCISDVHLKGNPVEMIWCDFPPLLSLTPPSPRSLLAHSKTINSSNPILNQSLRTGSMPKPPTHLKQYTLPPHLIRHPILILLRDRRQSQWVFPPTESGTPHTQFIAHTLRFSTPSPHPPSPDPSCLSHTFQWSL